MSENYQMQFLIEKTNLIWSDDAENEGKNIHVFALHNHHPSVEQLTIPRDKEKITTFKYNLKFVIRIKSIKKIKIEQLNNYNILIFNF